MKQSDTSTRGRSGERTAATRGRGQPRPGGAVGAGAVGREGRVMRRSARTGPVRTCVGCQRGDAPAELVRVVLGPGGTLLPDLPRRAPGRGAWVHPRSDCIGRAVPRGFARSFRAAVTGRADDLARAINQAASLRVGSLIHSAWRAHRLEVGTTSAQEALVAGRAVCVLVATDARAAAETPFVQQAVASGKALGWGTQCALGRATGHEEVAVLAVTDAGFAQALSTAVRLSQYPLPGLERPLSTRAAPAGGATEVG